MHTPTPWFLAGTRFKMGGCEWQSINRYDESKTQDENIAIVGFDPRTGLGRADALYIVKAVNAYDRLIAFLKSERAGEIGEGYPPTDWDRVQRIDDLLRELGE